MGDSTADKKVGLPGNVGVFAGSGAYAEFEDCVTASKLLPPVTYEHPGGKLGIWLQDSNYPDNVAGLDGRNPKWSLKRLGACD